MYFHNIFYIFTLSIDKNKITLIKGPTLAAPYLNTYVLTEYCVSNLDKTNFSKKI